MFQEGKSVTRAHVRSVFLFVGDQLIKENSYTSACFSRYLT